MNASRLHGTYTVPGSHTGHCAVGNGASHSAGGAEGGVVVSPVCSVLLSLWLACTVQ
jgi:hypothetical protein